MRGGRGSLETCTSGAGWVSTRSRPAGDPASSLDGILISPCPNLAMKAPENRVHRQDKCVVEECRVLPISVGVSAHVELGRLPLLPASGLS